MRKVHTMWKSRGIGAVAVAGAAALALSGCQQGSASNNDSDGDGDVVTLEFQSLSDQPATQAAVAAIVDEWNAENPDVQVELVQAGLGRHLRQAHHAVHRRHRAGHHPLRGREHHPVRAGRLPRRPLRPRRPRHQGRHLGRHLGVGDRRRRRSSPIPRRCSPTWCSPTPTCSRPREWRSPPVTR